MEPPCKKWKDDLWEILSRFQPDPFPLSDLPNVLQVSILKKLNYRDFSRFDECCRLTHNLAEEHRDFKYRMFKTYLIYSKKYKNFFYQDCLRYKVRKYDQNQIIPVDAQVKIDCTVLRVEVPLTAELLAILSSIVRTIYGVHLYKPIHCDIELFQEFIKKKNVCSLDIVLDNNYRNIPLESFEKMKCIQVRNAQFLSTETIFSLKTPYLTMVGCKMTGKTLAGKWTMGTDSYNKEFFCRGVRRPQFFKELRTLGIEYTELEHKDRDYALFFAVKRDYPPDPVLLIGFQWPQGYVLRSPQKNDWKALTELGMPVSPSLAARTMGRKPFLDWHNFFATGRFQISSSQ